MALRASFTDEQAMRQLAAESLFLLSTHSGKTAEPMLDRSDLWTVVMRGRPTLAEFEAHWARGSWRSSVWKKYRSTKGIGE